MKLKKYLCLGALVTIVASSSYMPVQAEVEVNGDCSPSTYEESAENREIRLRKEAQLREEFALERKQAKENWTTLAAGITDTRDSMNINLGLQPIKQETNYYCGPATCKIIIGKYGVNTSQKSLAEDLGTTTAGTVITNIAPVLNRKQTINTYCLSEIATSSSGLYGYDYDSWKSHIRYDIYKKYPLAIDIKVLETEQTKYEWKYPTQGHYCCISGYDNQSVTNTPYVWLTDPHPVYYGSYRFKAKNVLAVNMTHSRHSIIW